MKHYLGLAADTVII